MVQVTTFVGDLETIDSGTSIGAATDIVVTAVADLKMTLVFQEGAVPTVESKAVDKNHLELTLTAFSNALGTVWRSPVGTLNQRQLHLSLAVYLIGDAKTGTRIVHYCWALGAAIG